MHCEGGDGGFGVWRGGRLRGGEGLVMDLGRWFCKEMSLRDLSCVIIGVFVSGLGGVDGGWIAQAKGGGGLCD